MIRQAPHAMGSALLFQVITCLPASTEHSDTLIQSTTINNNLENEKNP
jgi:hypothetical protein